MFPEYPEFYATYKMMNVKNHHIYTDKFVLSVVDLKHMELATQEDREWKLDYWAALFKATTWEELKMLAQQSQILKEAVETVYDLTADEAIREQCKAREKYIKEINTVLREREIERQEKEIALAKLEQSEQQSKQKSLIINRQSQQINQLQQEIERLKAQQ